MITGTQRSISAVSAGWAARPTSGLRLLERNQRSAHRNGAMSRRSVVVLPAVLPAVSASTSRFLIVFDGFCSRSSQQIRSLLRFASIRDQFRRLTLHRVTMVVRRRSCRGASCSRRRLVSGRFPHCGASSGSLRGSAGAVNRRTRHAAARADVLPQPRPTNADPSGPRPRGIASVGGGV